MMAQIPYARTHACTRARTHLYLSGFRTSDAGYPQKPSEFVREARTALGDPPYIAVGEAPDRAVLEAVGQTRARLEDAVLRAAEAKAEGNDQAEVLADAAAEAARALVLARADVLAGPLYFLPQFCDGQRWRYWYTRVRERLLGFARLVSGRWIVKAGSYPYDFRSKLEMMGVGLRRLLL